MTVIQSKISGAYYVHWKDLDKWVVPTRLLLSEDLPEGWKYLSVSEFAKQVADRVRVQPDHEYKMLGVRLYGEGTFHRETVSGEQTSASYLYPTITGDFLYNRLFAWRGTFAIVPETHAGHFVSNEFPQFILDETKVHPKYLCLFFLTKRALKVVKSASIGSAAVSRNRFKEEAFLDFEIPLPPLSIQKKIVSYWEESQEQLTMCKAEIPILVNKLNKLLYSHFSNSSQKKALANRWFVVDFQDLERWDVKSGRAATFRIANPSFRPMGDFIEEAKELVRPWEEPEKEWPVFGVNNQRGVFFSHYQKGRDFNAPYKRIQKDWFFHNPTRANVGSLGIVPAVPEDAITSPEYQVWRIKQGMLPHYAAVLMRTKFFINLIQFNRVGAVKQRMYYDNLKEIRVPVLPEKEQQKIAQSREGFLHKIKEAEQRANQVKAEVEEMILGKRPIN